MLLPCGLPRSITEQLTVFKKKSDNGSNMLHHFKVLAKVKIPSKDPFLSNLIDKLEKNKVEDPLSNKSFNDLDSQ